MGSNSWWYPPCGNFCAGSLIRCRPCRRLAGCRQVGFVPPRHLRRSAYLIRCTTSFWRRRFVVALPPSGAGTALAWLGALLALQHLSGSHAFPGICLARWQGVSALRVAWGVVAAFICGHLRAWRRALHSGLFAFSALPCCHGGLTLLLPHLHRAISCGNPFNILLWRRSSGLVTLLWRQAVWHTRTSSSGCSASWSVMVGYTGCFRHLALSRLCSGPIAPHLFRPCPCFRDTACCETSEAA